MNKILENKFFRHSVVLVIGAVIGVLFYPAKRTQKEIEQKYQAQIEYLKKESKAKEDLYKESLDKEIAHSVKVEKEANQKISSLKVENNSLKQKIKEHKIKIVKPDGTIVEESFMESETEMISRVITNIREEFNSKVKSIEEKWKKIHEKKVVEVKQQYESKLQEKENVISEYKKKETVEVNPKNFGIAFGIMSNSQYYGNISYDFLGPLFLNLQLQSAKNLQDSAGGVGIGLRF